MATLSSLLLLVVSAGLGFYFTELRGPGIRTLLSGTQASELLVLVGGLAAIILTGHLAIANVARSAQGSSVYRKLVRKASEVDHTDPDAVSQFHAFPELRDFLNVLIAEKEQGHQLQDALEAARGETQGLFAGMERSLQDLGKMREDQPSELGRKVSTLWNGLIERVQAAEAAGPAVVGATKPSGSPAVGATVTSVLEQRLHDLEARVEQLLAAGAGGASQILVTQEDIVAARQRPLLQPEVAPEVIDLQGELEPISPLLSVEDEPQDLDDGEVTTLEALEPLTDDELDDVGSPMAVRHSGEGSVIIESPDFGSARTPVQVQQPVPVAAEPRPTMVTAWQEEALDAADNNPTPQTSTLQGSEATVVEEPEKEHVFSEWSGAGFASLSGLTKQKSVGFGVAPASSGDAAPSTTTDFAFPEFGVQQPPAQEDHVEVTYDGTTELDVVDQFPAFDAPAEEVVMDEGPTFEIDDDDVVDLRSLGAVETKE